MTLKINNFLNVISQKKTNIVPGDIIKSCISTHIFIEIKRLVNFKIASDS